MRSILADPLPDAQRRRHLLADRTSGSWNAASGSSNGWQHWEVDLGPYAGQQVEVSLTYVSDWAIQGLGVFLDDITDPNGSTSFEGGLEGWTVAGPPPGGAPNFNDYTRITSTGFPEGPVMAADPAADGDFRTLYSASGSRGSPGRPPGPR